MKQEVARHQLGKYREVLFFDDGSVVLRMTGLPNGQLSTHQFMLLKEDVDRLEKVLKWR